MPRYRKKPVVVEAVQWRGDNDAEVFAFYDGDIPLQTEQGIAADAPKYIIVPTLEGYHQASPGDWIIKGVQGEFYPCKPDIFEATYEEAEDA